MRICVTVCIPHFAFRTPENSSRKHHFFHLERMSKIKISFVELWPHSAKCRENYTKNFYSTSKPDINSTIFKCNGIVYISMGELIIFLKNVKGLRYFPNPLKIKAIVIHTSVVPAKRYDFNCSKDT
jgi:hypothetical protein